MEIPQNKKIDLAQKLNFQTDVEKAKDILGSDIVTVHDFFGKSNKINKMSDVFPQSNNNDDETFG